MIAMTTTCPDPVQLRRLLEGSLPDAEQPVLAAHLESCPHCQRQLEQLAAGALTWEAVARQLKSGEHARAATAPQLAAAIQSLKTQAASNDPPLADVSPDLPPGFLGPPSEPGHLGRLGDYEVHEEVGRGAMGVVLRGFDPKLHRVVALKVMSPQLASFPLARQRFVREGRSAAAVCHEHIVTIYEIADTASLPYIVMQYVAGKTLQERLDQSGPFKTAEILRIGMQAAAGLAAAHAQGLVHRDIKPANLLLENGIERVKLTDFGLARAVDDASITQTGVITGTPQFMAPEQARGEPLDGRADLFSLGCVLYTLCTGRPPFRAVTTVAVLKRICDDEPRPSGELNPEIPDWLAAIVRKLLAKQPGERFQSAKELSELLGQCLAHMQQPSSTPLPVAAAALANLPPAPLPAPTPEQARRHWLTTPWGIVAIVAAATLPFLLALFNNWMDGWNTEPPTPRSSVAPAVKPADPEELAELDRLVGVAQKQWLMTKTRYEHGQVPISETLAAEIEFVDAKVRHARAAGKSEQVVSLLQEIMALREKQVGFVKQQVEVGMTTPSALLAAEKALSEARLELRRAEKE
jgi:serine/threonine protein kinase